MGFFSWLFGKSSPKTPLASVKYSTSATTRSRAVPDSETSLLSAGWKRDLNGDLFPPDTVWAGRRSQVYHYLDYCCGAIICNDPDPMTEAQAKERGLRPCSKCRWGKPQYP